MSNSRRLGACGICGFLRPLTAKIPGFRASLGVCKVENAQNCAFSLSFGLKSRRLLGLVLCGLCAMRIGAATVSFLVIETGLPKEAGNSVHSGLWESGLLDVFFEAGHIVSNAPVLRLAQKPAGVFPEDARPDLAEAVEGGADFFILALLDYSVPANELIQKPRHVSLRLFQTRPHKLLYEQQYNDTGPNSLDTVYENLKRAARGLLPHLNDR